MMNSNDFSHCLSLLTIPQVRGESFGFDGSRELVDISPQQPQPCLMMEMSFERVRSWSLA